MAGMTIQKPTFGAMNELKFSVREPYAVMDHQIYNIKWQIKKEEKQQYGLRGGINASQMGLGKTLSGLCMTKCKPGIMPDLFVVNKALIDNVVSQCVKFFGSTLTYVVIHKEYMPSKTNLNNFDKSWIKGFDLVIMTYNTISTYGKKAGIFTNTKTRPSIKRAAENFYNIHWNRVIVDESQKLVQMKTQTFASLNAIKSDFRMCLTGTPIKSYNGNLRGQFVFLGYDPSIPWNIANYRYYGLNQYLLQMTFEEAKIELPKSTEIVMLRPFAEEEQEEYKLQVARCRKLNEEKAGILIQNAVVKLRTMCCGTTKIQMIIDVLADVPEGDKVIIFSPYKVFLIELQAVLSDMDLGDIYIVNGSSNNKRKYQIMQDFEHNPKTNILLLSHRVGGFGLNLTCANIVIMTAPDMEKTMEQQCIARINRMGQRKETYTIKLGIEKTIEENMMKQHTNQPISKFLNKELIELFL